MDAGTLTTALGALVIVLGLIVLSARVSRRLGLSPTPATNTGRQIVVLETVALGPRRRLTLLCCAGRRLVFVSGGPQDLLVPLGEERA